MVIRDESIFNKLVGLAQEQQRYTHGVFNFPFGEIRYVDPLTLQIQYEEIFVQRLYDYLTDEDWPLILDCGGNIGMSVIRFRLEHPNSRIITFEADPSIADVLRQNLSTMGMDDVEIVEAAVWDSNGNAKFEVEGAEGGRLHHSGQIDVSTIRLADHITENVDMLKLDIEGAEWKVLMDLGQQGVLQRIKHIIIEFHGTRENSRLFGDILSMLTHNNFSFTFPWSFCEPDLAGVSEPTPFPYAKDAKFILFLHAWRND